MNKILKLLVLLSVIFLSGCAGEHASFNESMKDNFLFTSAKDVSGSESKCIRLVKPFSFKSGMVTFSLPAGSYIARKKHDSGYFYYAPSPVTTSTWLFPSQDGIYLNNQGNQGNIFGVQGYGRPVRGAVLPQDIFSYLKKC